MGVSKDIVNRNHRTSSRLTHTHDSPMCMFPPSRKYFVLETSSAAGLLDRRDVTGESPYTFSEVVPGQVWTATYCYQ